MALEHLARGVDRDALGQVAESAGTPDTAAQLSLALALARIERNGFVRYTVADSRGSIATLEPVAPGCFLDNPVLPGRCLLSRFACLRRVHDALIIESPLGHARVVLHGGRGAAVLAQLAVPRTLADLSAQSAQSAMSNSADAIEPEAVGAFVGLLARAKMVWPCDDNGRIAEDDSEPLRHWEFHDLLFHSHSRMGRHDHPYAAALPWLATVPPSPVTKPSRSGRRTRLYVPDIQALMASDVPFTRVAEARRSIRPPGDSPPRLEQLGEFLYRVARIQTVVDASPEKGRPCDVSLRPCASGGGLHPLELYLTVSRCLGVDPGFYHYDPLAHELEHVGDLGPPQRRLLEGARHAAGTETPPDILITLAARFARVARKYQSIAYAMVLKDVGALYQQMYLVATALNLAPCALGGGDADAFAEAAGVEYATEASVGEFMLSGR